MQDELAHLQTELSKTIIFITHDLDEAIRLGDRIAVMKDGRIHQIGTPEEILRSPATDYVAAFVEGVNPWSVITAEHIMDKPDALVKTKDGPRVAVRKMRDKGLSSVFVVDGQERFAGLVTVDDAVQAIERDDLSLDKCLKRDIPTVSPDVTLEELVPLGAEARYPLPVVNADGTLEGIIVRAAILTGLKGRNHTTQNTEDSYRS